jgi:hypothetical protein
VPMYPLIDFTAVVMLVGMGIVAFLGFVLGMYASGGPERRRKTHSEHLSSGYAGRYGRKGNTPLVCSWAMVAAGMGLGLLFFVPSDRPVMSMQMLTNVYVDARPLVPALAVVASAIPAGVAFGRRKSGFMLSVLGTLAGIAAMSGVYFWRLPIS